MIDPSNRYGMMRAVEADLVDRVLDQLKTEFGAIRFLEVGVMGANTVRGIYRRAQELSIPVSSTGIDFEHYRPNPTPGANYTFIGEDSMDAFRKITGTFNILLVDGCHCCNHVMCDFSNYSPFVELNGRVIFHDTAKPSFAARQEAWPQDHSYAGKPPSTLGVREGLQKLGLLQGYRTDWKLIEEVPSGTGLMGAILFQRVKEL